MASHKALNEEHVNAVKSWMEEILGKTYDDFWEDIRDGVELCELINKIKPDTCKKFKKSKIVFVARNNLTIFRQGCLSIGIDEGRVIIPSDLYDKQNLNQVISNLYAISGMSVKYGFKGPVLEEPEPEPEPEPKEPTPEVKEPTPEPEPEPSPSPSPEQKVDDSSLLSIFKTLPYTKMSKNDKIHWTEFRDDINNRLGLGIDENKLRIIFDDIDTDKDEYITKDEYKKWMEKLNSLHLDVLLKGMNDYVEKDATYTEFSFNQSGVNWLYNELKNINIQSLDNDNNGNVKYESFKKYLVDLGKNVPNMVIDKVWKSVDKYNTQTITVEQYNQYLNTLTTDALKDSIIQ